MVAVVPIKLFFIVAVWIFFSLFKMTSNCFLKFLSYNIEGVSSKLRNEKLLSEIMKYDFISIPGFFHSQKGEQRIKKPNDTLGV